MKERKSEHNKWYTIIQCTYEDRHLTWSNDLLSGNPLSEGMEWNSNLANICLVRPYEGAAPVVEGMLSNRAPFPPAVWSKWIPQFY